MENQLIARLRGIIPACVTPMTGDGDVDPTGLRRNIEHWNQTDLAGYLLLGSTGETVMLSEREQAVVLEAGRQAIPPTKLMIAGTGQQSTQATIVATRRAAEAGADVALVMPHFYFKGAMTAPVLARHYFTVADASPIPLMLYSVPQFTGVPLGPELVAELAQHPNIVGIKDSAGDAKNLDGIRRRTSADFRVFTGSVVLLAGALASGSTNGAILAAANIGFSLALALDAAVQRSDLERARHLHRRLMEVADEAGRLGIGGWKAGMELLGLAGGPARPPLPTPDATARARLRDTMARAGLPVG
ncbi:MAG: dihydrodipicolinate synthase family protein [Ardenticatenaceae bacterium]|nr:dihydrodipicolinate synthase family protein [Ardenticatenaceae bacterium]